MKLAYLNTVRDATQWNKCKSIQFEKVSQAVVDVPWGFYHLTQGEKPPRWIGTTSMASCFAFGSYWSTKQQLFFAHIATDEEAKHVQKNVAKLSLSETFSVKRIIVVGGEAYKQKRSATLDRVNLILGEGISVAFGFAPLGSVAWDPTRSEVCGGAYTKIKRKAPLDENGALNKSQDKQLWSTGASAWKLEHDL